MAWYTGFHMADAEPTLRLIDAAYKVADEAEHLEKFYDEIESYLFRGLKKNKLKHDGPAPIEEQTGIERHTHRISRLVARSIEEADHIVQTNHAVLILSERSRLVTGNEAARSLLACRFPCAFEDLPFDHEAVANIREVAQNAFLKDQVCLISVETEQVHPCLALIQRPAQENGSIRISISYIEWSKELLEQIGTALQLSNSEIEILEGYLYKRSQKEIAQQRERSLETVKVQSKSILRKARASKMSEVVQLAAGIAYLYRLDPVERMGPSADEWITPKTGLRYCRRKDGSKFGWYKIGSGQIPILFVHGLVQGPFFSGNFARKMSDAGFHLLCPSRPGFGYSDPSLSRESYTTTVVEDALTLLESEKIESCVVMNQQGGTNHSFRIANALGSRCLGLYLVDSGVPTSPEDLEHIERNSRILAGAAMRAPSLLKMVTGIGRRVYRKRGARALLELPFGNCPYDLATLDNADMFRLQAFGVFHVTQQSSEIWVREGMPMMNDWSDEFQAYNGRQYWLQGALSTIMEIGVIQRYLKRCASPNIEMNVLPDAGNTLYYTHEDEIIEGMKKIHAA